MKYIDERAFVKRGNIICVDYKWWVFGITWGLPHVMLNVVKHPRGEGFFVSLRMTKTPANPKEPKWFNYKRLYNGIESSYFRIKHGLKGVDKWFLQYCCAGYW